MLLREAQRQHAISRYFHRYGQQLTDFDHRALSCRVFRHIAGSRTVGVEEVRGAGRMVFFVRIANGYALAAWSESTQQIATFLPLAVAWPRVTGVSSAHGVHDMGESRREHGERRERTDRDR